MYSGIFYNLFLIWGKYKRSPLKTTLAVFSSSTTRRWTASPPPGSWTACKGRSNPWGRGGEKKESPKSGLSFFALAWYNKEENVPLPGRFKYKA